MNIQRLIHRACLKRFKLTANYAAGSESRIDRRTYSGPTRTESLSLFSKNEDEAKAAYRNLSESDRLRIDALPIDAAPAFEDHDLAEAQGHVRDLHRQIADEETRHNATMAALNGQLATAKAKADAIEGFCKHECTVLRIVEQQSPGAVARLAALYGQLVDGQPAMLLESIEAARGDADRREKEAREAFEDTQKQIAALQKSMAESYVVEPIAKAKRMRELARSLPVLRRELEQAEAANQRRKPLAWHQAKEAALVDQYNAIIRDALSTYVPTADDARPLILPDRDYTAGADWQYRAQLKPALGSVNCPMAG